MPSGILNLDTGTFRNHTETQGLLIVVEPLHIFDEELRL